LDTTTNDSAVVYYPFTITDIIAKQEVSKPYYIEMIYRQPDGNVDGISTGFWGFDKTQCANCEWNEIDYFEHAGHSNVFTHNFIWKAKTWYRGQTMAFNSPSVSFNRDENLTYADNYWEKTNDIRTQLVVLGINMG